MKLTVVYSKVDWPHVVNIIRSRYKPISQVAKEVRCDSKSLQNLARGDIKEPRYTTGVLLLELYEKLTRIT